MTARDIADRLLIYYRYLTKVGRWPDLDNPRTFSEKVQVAKLTWRSPAMPMLADKVRVKQIVARRLGPDWVTPTLFHGAALPPRAERDWPLPFVIKANNGCGKNIFVRTEADLDWDLIERKVERWMTTRHGIMLGEWAYADIAPQILVEPVIGEPRRMVDYKCFCFGGRLEYIETHLRDGGRRECANMDRDWVLHPFTLKYPVPSRPVPRPASLDELIRGAEELAKGFPFARVDLYEIDGRPRFGEVTFYPASGFVRSDPPEYDRIYGELWPPGLPTAELQ